MNAINEKITAAQNTIKRTGALPDDHLLEIILLDFKMLLEKEIAL